MPSVDPGEVEDFANRVYAREDALSAYRSALREAQVDSTEPFGGADAPWAQDMSETWDQILDYRVTDCDNVRDSVEKIYLNLLCVAARWREDDGQTEDDFNGTGASLEEHASGEFFEEW